MTTQTKLAVPFLDLPAENCSIADELDEAIHQVISRGQFILGPAVERFEQAFAEYLGAKYCVGLNNGTSALHLALEACDIGPGDEVITTPHSWISTSWAISYVGARPVFVDIDPVTYNLDPQQVERALTPQTRAILPVHLYGQACDLEALGRIADRNNVDIIEDAAQAHGALNKERRVGTFGRAGCFSFYPGKNLGAFGEAGAVVTDDEHVATRIRRLRDHAQDGRHRHVEIGHNARMEGIQGAVLDVKLRHLDKWNARRARHARRYCELLSDVPNLRPPECPRPSGHVWHLFVILLRGIDRGRLQSELAERGIATAVHYPIPIPFQPAYTHLGYKPGDFPVAEAVMANCLSLPMFAALTDEQIDYVAATIKSLLANGALQKS
ncbi:MAG TPA: DegT/DnrJ/EryC1/StrS family aminotransferase [Planctomycetaceae bacterium]|jgi:dTDP-4-amino-4,6-dideoxygalactose transaminase|nr:DegT/DnrJ/EryC1/StrS family aminotransferase [Planctomycetaceae bacterium]